MVKRACGYGTSVAWDNPAVSRQPTPTSTDLERLVRLVVDTVQPLRIVLFGSAARNELRDQSDLDLLVVMPDGANLLHTEMALYHALACSSLRLGRTVQFVATTADLFEAQRGDARRLAYHAAREGRELYAA